MPKKKTIKPEARIGNQEPTRSYILPYTQTKGPEAVKIYNRNNTKQILEWQENLLYDIMAYDDEGLWVHQKFGLSVPRQNGKTEIIIAICMWALKNGYRVLYTAHKESTCNAIYRRMSVDFEHCRIKMKSNVKAPGREHIYLDNGGQIEFRTRSSGNGLGESYDFLIIDEAQEFTETEESNLQYTLAASRNPQTIMIGTPPTTESKGTVFLHYRESVLAGEGYLSGWAEWSVDKMSDLTNEDLWYDTNPSLGLVLPVRNVRGEIGNGQQKQVDLNIQRLGLWLTYNQRSAINPQEWKSLEVKDLPQFKGKLFVGIKFGQAEHSAAMSIAVRTASGKIFIETIDDRPLRAGVDWIIDFLKKADWKTVIVDGQSGSGVLQNEMKKARLRPPELTTVGGFVQANTEFEQALEECNICHKSQASVEQIVSHCQKRSIGKTGWGYESQREGIDDAILDSMVLAHWACHDTPVPTGKKYQQVSY